MILLPKAAFILLFTCISFLSLSQDNIGRIWVTFESTDDVPEIVNNELRSTNSEIQTLIEQFNIQSVKQAIPASSKEELTKVYEISCLCNTEALTTVIKTESKALTHPELAPNYQLLDTPNDYLISYETDYALDLINAEEAWQYSIGDESTIIGISDANYHETHEDLEAKINYLDPQNSSTNYNHGTAVAITAAGHTDNGAGKSSIGYNCKMNLTALNYNKVLEMSQDGIRVINLSWASGCSPNTYVQSIIDEIYDNGTLLVAAAGNGSTCGGPSNPVFPAACDKVISVTSVGALDNHERIAGDPNSAHQHHSTVDICAPGYDIAISTLPEYYHFGSGTSFAAPLVTGTIGLMLSLKPCLTNEEILEILRISSDDIYDLNSDYIGLLGSGRLNAGKALELTSLNQCTDDGGIVIIDDTVIVIDDGNGNNGSGSDTNSKPNFNQTETIQDLTITDNSGTSSLTDLPETKVNIYPNPTTGSSTLSFEANEILELTILDTRGAIIDSREILPGNGKVEINVVEPGVYFLKVTKDGNQKWLGKLVKL